VQIIRKSRVASDPRSPKVRSWFCRPSLSSEMATTALTLGRRGVLRVETAIPEPLVPEGKGTL
jgi:hypothetical protein